MKQLLLLLMLAVLATGCHRLNPDDESQADEVLTAWAEAYFNCRYKEALRYVTPESERWLRFAASNMTEADVTLLNAQQQEATVVRSRYDSNSDSTAVAHIVVSNYLQATAIGQQGRMASRGEFDIPLVKRNKQWYVRMEGLPRSGRQSRD